MKCHIALFSILLGVVSAVPISRQLGGVSSDVHVLTVNGTQVCQLDGQLYQIDEDLPTEDPCEYCTCQPPGFACQVVKCEHKPECRALQRSGLCCPEYICDCEFKGKIYQNGERITDNDNKCEDCYCVTGEVDCSVIQCAAPPENCEFVQGGNRCCPTYRCPSNIVDEDRIDETTNVLGLIDDATTVGAPKITESIGTESPQEDIEGQFDNEATTTIKSQADLDTSEDEYRLAISASKFDNENLNDPWSSDSEVTTKVSQLPISAEKETTVEEERIDDENFSAMTDEPNIVDSVRTEDGTEAPTDDQNMFMSFIEGAERNVEEIHVVTSVPEVLPVESNTISMISIEFNDALKTKNEDSEVVEAITELIETKIQDISIFEVTERIDNAEEFDMTTDKVIKSHEESHDTNLASNEETTAPSSELQSFEDEMSAVTARSTEEEVNMFTSSPEVAFEDEQKTAKIKLNLNDILKSQDENYETIRSTIIDSEMENLSDQVTFSSEDMERFELTERNVEEITMPSIQLEQESVDVNKNDKEFTLYSKEGIRESVEETTAETETRIEDGSDPTELELAEMVVTERNADEESVTEEVNKIGKVNLSEIEMEFMKSQDTAVESSTDKLELFDSEIEEFETTQRSVEDLSMTTLQPEVIRVQAPKLEGAVSEAIDKREESLDNLESLDATERTDYEELITLKPSTNEEDIVAKLAKIEVNRKEQFDFPSSNLDSKDMTTERIESRIRNKEGMEMTTEFTETRTEKFIELSDEILEFGIKDVREEVEVTTTAEYTSFDSSNILQMTSPDIPVVKSDGILSETNSSMTIRDETITSGEKQKGEEASMAQIPKEGQEDDKLEYWMNMDTKGEKPTQDNQLTETDDTESTTITDILIIKENNEMDSVQNSVIELERDVEAAVVDLTETEEKNKQPVTEVSEAENKAAIELETLRPKKQRTHLHAHLSKKFGLRPLTRRTFSNDIEKRRTTRLRDRKMIVGRNRQNLLH